MLEIPGDYGEGGGSIVRLATALSAITQIPIKITNIRQFRDSAGLKTQHLRAIESVSNICNGELKNAYLGSKGIEFYPGKIEKTKLKVNIETAGSVGLLLQCLMLPCFFNGKETEIEITGGGTVGLHAPNLLYTENVLLPIIKKLGFEASLKIKKHGFFPKGGAHVIFKTKPLKPKPLHILDRGELIQMKGISLATEDLKNKQVAERQLNTAKNILKDYNLKINNIYTKSLSTGSALLLYTEFENTIIAWDSIGERGKPSEKIGEESSKGLLEQLNSEATLDDYMQDQILIFMALTKSGSFKFNKLTKHTETNIWLIEKFLPVKFKIKENIIEI